MFVMNLIILIITGLTAGVLAGMLGIGGGLVIVPIVTLILIEQGLLTGDAVHIAVATSIASILLTAIGSLSAHHRRGAVRWRFLLRYAPWIALGAWSASFSVAWLTRLYNGRLLIVAFVIFAVFTAFRLWRKRTALKSALSEELIFNWHKDGLIGIIVGHVSAVLGTGGGSINAPYFNARGMRMSTSVGTAAACGYPLALAGTLGFALQTLSLPESFAGSTRLLGSIDWHAALIIGSCGLLTAPLGARIAHALPEAMLRKVFAVVLLVLAARMLWL